MLREVVVDTDAFGTSEIVFRTNDSPIFSHTMKLTFLCYGSSCRLFEQQMCGVLSDQWVVVLESGSQGLVAMDISRAPFDWVINLTRKSRFGCIKHILF